MFACKVCKAKDERIADLKEQLEHQNKLVRHVVNPEPHIRIADRETQYALEGQGAPQDPERLSAIEQQAIDMRLGTY